MDPAFWHQRWASNQIGFHEADPHPLLVRHWHTLGLAPDSRVFVPLCGKSNDLLWLHAQGHALVGVELSEVAVEAFFIDNGLDATCSTAGPFEVSSAPGYTLLCGNFFALVPAALGDYAAIYDRAALIALPPPLRREYAVSLTGLAPTGTRMLLVTVTYDTGVITPPPFAVTADEVNELYGDDWLIGDRGCTAATIKGHPGTEQAFVLQRM